MPLSMAASTVGRIRRSPSDFILQVTGADDVAKAVEGLALAKQTIWALFEGDVRSVSDPIPTPEGPLMMVDASDASRWVLEGIAEMTMRCLEQVGLADGELGVRSQRQGRLAKANRWNCTRSVCLRLYPPPPPTGSDWRCRSFVPDDWLRDAWAWVSEGLGDEDLVNASMEGGVEFALKAGDALGFWSASRRADAMMAILVAGDIRSHYRGANARFLGKEMTLALGGGGRSATDAELAELVELFADFARSRADGLAHAFVHVATHHHFLGYYYVPPMGKAQPEQIERACDELLFDAFAWQLLGPGHIERLGGPPPGSRPLPGDRVELSIGTVAEWLDQPDRLVPPAIQEQGRGLLNPCLVDENDVGAVYEARRLRPPTPTANLFTPPDHDLRVDHE